MGTTSIIVIGTNPSKRSPTDSPFHPSTKSGQLVRSWFRNQNVSLNLANVSNVITEGNRALSAAEIRQSLPHLKQQVEGYNIVIAVGRIASKALKMLDVEHFEMWHPSGLCRKWNDKEAAASKLEELHDYINERR